MIEANTIPGLNVKVKLLVKDLLTVNTLKHDSAIVVNILTDGKNHL